MGNGKIYTQYVQIFAANEETSKINQINIHTYRNGSYHGAIYLSLIRDKCLSKIFESNADGHPTRPIIIFRNRKYTRKGIESEANRLLWNLRDKGFQTGDKIGLILEKSVELYASMLLILKAGIAYKHLVPGHPLDRIKNIIKNKNIFCTVTSSSIASLFTVIYGELTVGYTGLPAIREVKYVAYQ